jgi:hypothetical protein
MIQKLNSLQKNRLLKVSIIFNIILVSFIIGQINLDSPMNKHFKHKNLISKEIITQEKLKVKQQKYELNQALLEEPYNKEKVTKALNDLDKNMDSIRSLIHKAIIEKAATLKPQERLELLPPHLRLRHSINRNKTD